MPRGWAGILVQATATIDFMLSPKRDLTAAKLSASPNGGYDTKEKYDYAGQANFRTFDFHADVSRAE